jgi:CHAT domain-containing protein
MLKRCAYPPKTRPQRQSTAPSNRRRHVGFSQALMVAGARQLIANLWDANDDSTAELMVNLYHRMLGDGLSPAAALREAQLSLLRTEHWSPPYYWAGFRLQGDWR